MREKTVCFTGHRNIPNEQKEEVLRRLKVAITTLIDGGFCYFGAGGALGFDTLAAKAVLDLKKDFPQIKLILVFPCETQTRGWKEEDVRVYEEIKAKADKFLYTAKGYFNGCMQKRNRHLVDGSSVCVCYLTEDKGGTAYTVKYAEKQGLKIINIA